MNLIKCYTIATETPKRGIDTSLFDSIVSDSDVIKFAAVTMIPVVPNPGGLSIQSAALSVSFITGYEKASRTDNSGILLAYSSTDWRLLSDATHLVLLDPAGLNGDILVYVPKKSGPVLASSSDKTLTLEVTESCEPKISKTRRSSLLLAALQ